MDFVEPPFSGEGMEVPLVSSTAMGPDDHAWLPLCNQGSFVNSVRRLNVTHSQQEIAGIIQSWLYFGLLAVISGKAINGLDYSAPGKRWNTIVSSGLISYSLVDIKLDVLRLPREECKMALRRHKMLLVHADEVVRQVESCFSQNSTDLIDQILLSVKILVGTIAHGYDCALDNMFEQLCGTSMQWYDVAQRRGESSKAADRALERKMLGNGWCIHQAHKMLSNFNYQTSYYFARLPRPRSKELGHERCTRLKCRGWDSKPGLVHARHADDTCMCPTISVSSAEVAKIIRSGGIPLISIMEDMHGSLTLKLHTKTSSSKYVAISHVWADGLGNAFENGLPACQLRMLRTYLKQISTTSSKWSALLRSATTTLFWMDTLCIPVQISPPGIPFSTEDLNDIKGKAIDKMNMVYSSSSHTLVLDAEMRMLPISADDATKLAYSQCCGWTTRSWTLQEGCLPPLTIYALADGIYCHEARSFSRRFGLGKLNFAIRAAYILFGKRFTTPSLVLAARGLSPEKVSQSFDFSVHRDIWMAFSTRYFSIWDAYHPVTSKRPTAVLRNKYAKIWNELLDRASSQPADTPAIFANLVGVSAYEVLKRETEQERVALIIRQQQVLPIEILFNTGPRLKARLHEQTSSSRMSPSQLQFAPLENIPEESIGLLDLSELQAKTFKNGWVPAMIGGDRIPKPLVGEAYLQLFADHIQIHENDEERYAYMFTTTASSIPAAKFILEFKNKCQTQDRELTACARDSLITISRTTDYAQEASHEDKETAIGHCFLYDPGSLLAMSNGLVECAQGSHLIILSRSEGRLITQYSGPIRFDRMTKKSQNMEHLAAVKCDCNIHSGKEFVDILYDAGDLGPLLTASSKSPGQMFLEHWLNPIAILVAHALVSGALKPYIGTLRPRLVNAAYVVMPATVYMYQNFIVNAAAKRLFLEPLNDRGQLEQMSRSCARSFRRITDTAITAHWGVILFGPVLDGCFWLALKGSEGKDAAYSKLKLFVAVTYMAHWYLLIGTLGTRGLGAKIAEWYYIAVVLVIIASAAYDIVTSGLGRYGSMNYLVLIVNLWGCTYSIKSLSRGKR